MSRSHSLSKFSRKFKPMSSGSQAECKKPPCNRPRSHTRYSRLNPSPNRKLSRNRNPRRNRSPL